MTENQKKFIMLLYKRGEMNTIDCFKHLHLRKSKEISSYFEILCDFIAYSGYNEDFDRKIHLTQFELEEDKNNDRAMFSLTPEGEEFVEDQKRYKNSNKYTNFGIIISVIGVIATIVIGILPKFK